MNVKKKIVFVSSRFPIPRVGGFEIKNYQLIKQLSKKFSISAHFIQHNMPKDSDIRMLNELCEVHIHRPRILDVAARLVINTMLGIPLQNALYFSSSARMEIEKDLESASAAICSVIRTGSYIEKFDGPKFYDLADSLGQLYKNNLKHAKGWYRLVYRLEASRLLKMEKKIVDTAEGVFFFNRAEADLYSYSSNVYVVPHGVSEEIFRSSHTDPGYNDGLSFIGKLDVAHNVDMIQWFVKNVMPLVPDHLKLYLIGSNPSSSILALAEKDRRIVVTGFIDDPYPVLRGSVASICPMQTGGGIQNKIIESLACGAVVIATSKAMIPLDRHKKSGILVCDSPEDWAYTISDLINSPNRHKFRREIAQKYAASRFTWNAYGDAILKLVEGTVDENEKKDSAFHK